MDEARVVVVIDDEDSGGGSHVPRSYIERRVLGYKKHGGVQRATRKHEFPLCPDAPPPSRVHMKSDEAVGC